MIFLQPQMAPQLTMTAPHWPALHTTISLAVKFLVVCEIVAHHGPHIPISPEHFIFVDYKGLSDQMTSTDQTERRHKFRKHIKRRDGSFCVITRQRAVHCDAAHLIPWSKGDEVTFVIILCGSFNDGLF